VERYVGRGAPDSEHSHFSVDENAPNPNAKDAVNFYLVGCIDYFDTFHDAHRTTYCEAWNANGVPGESAFLYLDTGNSAD
jgi:hypothetical protein